MLVTTVRYDLLQEIIQSAVHGDVLILHKVGG